MRHWPLVTLMILSLAGGVAGAQENPATTAQAPAYQPKFPGDPAHSDAEAVALAYVRTVSRAEAEYYKKHSAYTTSLAALAGHGSFTKRMVNTNRGDYTAKFRSTGKQYSLEMIPKQYDAQHRSFYVDETGVIRGEENEPATAKSESVGRR